ncbi:hypothetical protein THAOC_13113 [Thalassiosira oceanica]|uniref:Uncharacterized protein n=1 Tax=Thalassiosira oceanica TaxID=159749 RepID=K0T6B6_THAOC|nr:hypothetical protein THAOC_13113 [Thalassiosira oceanica]|eukprot:EJK65987.1 hypothetical protein THAOC_13113 [Thalassiosira oceanica]
MLSSTTGNSSTKAHTVAMARSLRSRSPVLRPKLSIAPVFVNHVIKPYDPATDPATRAALPATDLDLLNDHLFEAPNLLPSRSARPSPHAIVATLTMPTGLSLQKTSVEKIITKTYTKGPPSASLASPDLDIASASSTSDDESALSLELDDPATTNRTAIKNGTMLAKALAPSASEKKGQQNTNRGADKVWMIFLASRGTTRPVFTESVHSLTNADAPASVTMAAPASLSTCAGVYGLHEPENTTPNGSVAKNGRFEDDASINEPGK